MRGVIVLAIAIALSATAHADDEPIEKARDAIDQLDYPAAQKALVEALATGTNGPEQLAEIYRLTGIVTATLGDNAAAIDAFRRLLALDPKAVLPAGTSPKIQKPFTDASKKKLPLVVKTDTKAQPPSVTVVVESDPAAMVAGAKVLFVVDGKPEATLEGKGDKRIEITLPKGKRIDLRVQALDKHGNRLVQLGTATVPIVIVGAEPEVATPINPTKKPGTKVVKKREPREERPLYLKWWMWTGVAVVFGGATTYFALQARSDIDELQRVIDASPNHRAGEADDLEDSARRNLLFTNIGLGATAVFAAGAAILFFTEPDDEEPRNVALVPIHGGGAFVVGGKF